jgi:hypothetical protein
MQTDKKFILQVSTLSLVGFLIGLGLAMFIWGVEPARVYEIKTYENKDLHLKFSYSDFYLLSEENTSTTSKLILQNEKQGGGMFIESFNRGVQTDIAEWIKNNSSLSRFDLSDKNIETAIVGDKKIISYNWSSDLSGNTLAFINEGRIYLFTVASINKSDKINKDFVSLISTLELI